MLLKSGNFRRKVKKYRNTVTNRQFQAVNQPIQQDYNCIINNPDPVVELPESIPESVPSNETSQMTLPEPIENNHFENVSMTSLEFESSSDESLNQSSAELGLTCSELSADTVPMEFAKTVEEVQTNDLQTFLRSWSFEYHIRQHAMKPLLHRLNQLDSKLPTDPRRLLSTPRNKHPITSIEGGQYWHQGIGKMLKKSFVKN